MTGWRSPILIVVLVLGVMFSLLYFSFTSMTERSAAPIIVTVIIPNGSSIESSKHNNFEPEVIKVVIGVNNTVRWVNQDITVGSVVASDLGDPDFFNATKSENQTGPPKSVMAPGESFEFTFMKPGTFEYYSVPHPHKQGTVIVLPPSN